MISFLHQVCKTALETGSTQPEAALCAEATPSNQPELRMRKALGEIGQNGLEARMIHQLVSVVGKISNADSVLLEAGPPLQSGDSEAEKWRQVSVQTAKLTRQALVSQQKQYLEQLFEAVRAKGPFEEMTPPTTASQSVASLASNSSEGEGSNQGGSPRALTSPAVAQRCPEAEREAAAPKSRRFMVPDADGSMKLGLNALRDHAANRVLIVRKIKKLGFESPELLKEYLLQFGEVAEVHVANSMMKPSPKRPAGRVRPAALGFVVMATEEGAIGVLALGMTHRVGSVDIEVTKFEPFEEFGDGDEEEV